MRLLTRKLLKIFVRDYEDAENPDVKAKYGSLEAWVSIVSNVVLSVIKFALGLISNSIALTADAFHTFSDVVTSVIVLVGFKASRRPADTGHPFGHGRTEVISTLIIGVLLAVVGFNFLRDSFDRIFHPQPVRGGVLVITVLAISAYFKEVLTVFSMELGKKIEASSLLADAWNHRSDAIASLLIAVAIIASRYNYFIVDSILGIGISAIIIYVGVKFSYNSASRLLGQAPSKEILSRIEQQARAVRGVNSVHDIEVHEYGEQLRVSLHIEVNNRLGVSSAHQIAEAVEKKLLQALRITAVVHVDPTDGR